MILSRWALAVLVFCAVSHADVEEAPALVSFEQARDRVFAEPLEELPQHPGISTGRLLGAALGIRGKLFKRAEKLFNVERDFKPQLEPKLFHPMGICSAGTWVITQKNPYTGLFEEGARVPLLARLSTGTQQTTSEKGKTRLFGIALKLFPAPNPKTASYTRNIHMLDGSGLEGDERDAYFGPMSDGTDVIFGNHAAGKSLPVKMLNRAFERLDQNPAVRPTWPLGDVRSDGSGVEVPVTPKFLQLLPAFAKLPAPPMGTDFRDEILRYGEDPLVFTILANHHPIGQVTLGRRVVSDVCDQSLNFTHPRNR